MIEFSNERAYPYYPLDFTPSWVAWCPKHKHYSRVLDADAFTGFAGGTS